MCFKSWESKQNKKKKCPGFSITSLDLVPVAEFWFFGFWGCSRTFSDPHFPRPKKQIALWEKHKNRPNFEIGLFFRLDKRLNGFQERRLKCGNNAARKNFEIQFFTKYKKNYVIDLIWPSISLYVITWLNLALDDLVWPIIT